MRRAIPPLAAFAALCGHASWAMLAGGSVPGCAVPASTLPEHAALYVAGGSIWMGASYALAAGFFTYSLQRYRRDHGRAAAGAAGGLAVGGAIYAAGCFVLGCCGSPMLPVYLGLLGGKWAGAGGPLVFVLTLASVGLGYVLMSRRDRCGVEERETEDTDGSRKRG